MKTHLAILSLAILSIIFSCKKEDIYISDDTIITDKEIQTDTTNTSPDTVIVYVSDTCSNTHEDTTTQTTVTSELSISIEECSPSSASSYYPKAQSFKYDKSVNISSIEVYMNSPSNESWTLRVLSALPSQGGPSAVVSKTEIESFSIGKAEVNNSSSGWVEFNFPTSINIEPGTEYYIFADSYDLGDGPDAEWCSSPGGAEPGPYQDGQGLIFVANWSDNGNVIPEYENHSDYAFRIYTEQTQTTENPI